MGKWSTITPTTISVLSVEEDSNCPPPPSPVYTLPQDLVRGGSGSWPPFGVPGVPLRWRAVGFGTDGGVSLDAHAARSQDSTAHQPRPCEIALMCENVTSCFVLTSVQCVANVAVGV